MTSPTQADKGVPDASDYELAARYLSSTAFGGTKAQMLDALRAGEAENESRHPLVYLAMRHREEAARNARLEALGEFDKAMRTAVDWTKASKAGVVVRNQDWHALMDLMEPARAAILELRSKQP